MKVEYNNRTYEFTITKEDLQKYTPEQLAYMMIDRIERMLFAECMKTAINKMSVGKLTLIQKRGGK